MGVSEKKWKRLLLHSLSLGQPRDSLGQGDSTEHLHVITTPSFQT